MAGPLQGNHPLSSPVAVPEVSNRLSELRTGYEHGRKEDSGSEALSPLGSDISDGPRRLVADPDSPTSRLLERAARRSLANSQKNTPEKFSYIKDIARNPDIARAARRALSSSSPSEPFGGAGGGGGAAGGGDNGGLQHLHFGHELDHQTAVIDQLDRDAAGESTINQQMASVMLGRLQSGRQAAERTLGVLQAFAAAEVAYARAMSSVAKLSLSSEADGPTLRAAVEQFSDLPSMMGMSHSSVAERLQEAIRGLQALVTDLRGACQEVVSGAGRAKREVEASRHALKAALRSHKEACHTFEQVATQRQKPGRGRGVENDPWLTEGCLVEQQVRLQRAQQVERQYLAKAFQRVGELERRRAAAVQHTFGTFVHIYRSAVVPIQQIADELEGMLSQIDADADLEAFTDIAASSVRSAEALSARQREVVDQICGEMLGSAEIVRQGTMERWDSNRSKWQPGHLVLTRAGFLHRFSLESAAGRASASSSPQPPRPDSAEDDEGGGGGGGGEGRSSINGSGSSGGGASNSGAVAGHMWWGGASSWSPPIDTLNLSRCSFEQGEAPVFRIIEAASGGLSSFALFSARGRTQTLKAGSIEECMDWAIAVREAIAACSG